MLKLYVNGLEALRFGPGWAIVQGMGAGPGDFSSALERLADAPPRAAMRLVWQDGGGRPLDVWERRTGLLLKSEAGRLFSRCMDSGGNPEAVGMLARHVFAEEAEEAQR